MSTWNRDVDHPYRRICIQWPTFGPYHAARLNAAAAAAAVRGFQVIGLETAGRDETYGFSLAEDPAARRITVYPDRTFEHLSPHEIRAGIRQTLDALDPLAVAITSYSFPDARACLEWCREHKRIAILMSSTKQDDAVRRGWREMLKRVIVSGFDAAIVGGTPQQSYLMALGFPVERIFRGYNVVDNRHFEEGARRAREHVEEFIHLPGLDDPAPFFLASGRMIERKNYDRLLAAYARYRERTADPWRLVIVGDGPGRNEVEDLIAARGIAGVTLAGFHGYEELPAYYGQAAALVHPALKDQWALVVNEAMAAGLPVIVSNGCGCTTDLVKDGENGFVFDPLDEQQLTDLLAGVASDPAKAKRMGCRSSEIMDDWGPEKFGSALVNALDYVRREGTRPASPALPAVLTLLRRFTRRVDDFHTVEA